MSYFAESGISLLYDCAWRSLHDRKRPMIDDGTWQICRRRIYCTRKFRWVIDGSCIARNKTNRLRRGIDQSYMYCTTYVGLLCGEVGEAFTPYAERAGWAAMTV